MTRSWKDLKNYNSAQKTRRTFTFYRILMLFLIEYDVLTKGCCICFTYSFLRRHRFMLHLPLQAYINTFWSSCNAVEYTLPRIGFQRLQNHANAMHPKNQTVRKISTRKDAPSLSTECTGCRRRLVWLPYWP
jgi:hypothetical protein